MKKKNFIISNKISGIVWFIFGLIAYSYRKDLGLAVTLWGISLMFLWNATMINLKN